MREDIKNKNIKFVLAPDSFKESMTAKEVCQAMELGIRKVHPNAEIISVPMADGGEGTVQALVDATNGTLIEKMVTGPLGKPVNACYGILGDNKTAVIEMASASGIQYVNKSTKNPMITTTYGTGELILECLDKNINNIILGIGGSATNDGGSGMASALGIKFLDKDGNPIPQGGGNLGQLVSIDISGKDPRLEFTNIIVASDVTNPLCGQNGASHVFGPQKGASPDMIDILDENLNHYANIIKHDLKKDIKDLPGAGAAGGLGAGLLAFTNCTLKPGIDIVIEYSDLISKLDKADYCFTGEGKIDFQTKFGKTPCGVAKTAKEINPSIVVIAIAGLLGEDIDTLYDYGFDGIFGIAPGSAKLSTLLKEGPTNVERTSENIARILGK